MTVVGTPFAAKSLARLVAMVVFPDPPFELITSVVFILMSFAPFPHRATEKRQGYAKVMVCVINYFTGDAKSPRSGWWACPGGPTTGRPAGVLSNDHSSIYAVLLSRSSSFQSNSRLRP